MTHPVDAQVGKTLRNARKLRGMSQTDLGRKLGLSFQQVQKYELGTNRVAASRLFEVSQALDLPVTAFFPDQEVATSEAELSTEEAKLIRALRAVKPEVRTAVANLCEAAMEGERHAS